MPKNIKNKNKFQKIEDFLSKNYDVRFNSITNSIECKLKNEIHFTIANENSIYRKLQHNKVKCTINDLTILLRSDFVESYNPLLNYFENLPKWDLETDYITHFAQHVKSKNQEHFNKHFKKMLVRSIACSLNEKVVNKQAFILVHAKQNSGKSSWVRYLCPSPLQGYYTENLALNKDGLIALTENFIINLDELALFSKAQIDMVKSIFSQEMVKVRHPYERKAKSQPRISNFFGSTNQMEFLTDETGNVRWLCFEIEQIDWSYTKISIGNVWSQAFTLYKNGFQYQLTVEDIEENEKMNKQFMVSTKEMELIMKYFYPATKEKHDLFATATDIIEYLQSKASITYHLSESKIGKALKVLGFERETKFNGRYSVKGYFLCFFP